MLKLREKEGSDSSSGRNRDYIHLPGTTNYLRPIEWERVGKKNYHGQCGHILFYILSTKHAWKIKSNLPETFYDEYFLFKDKECSSVQEAKQECARMLGRFFIGITALKKDEDDN